VDIIDVPKEREPLETLETFLGTTLDRAPADEAEMHRLREAAKTDPLVAAILDLHDHDSIDVDAIVELRAVSPAWC
jgi:hypothetical protein